MNGIGKAPEYELPTELPPAPTVEEACKKVDSWTTSEANTFGLHMLARTLRNEVARLQERLREFENVADRDC